VSEGNKMGEVVIASAVRTAIGRINTHPDSLGQILLKQTMFQSPFFDALS
jgi:hypothetical protein